MIATVGKAGGKRMTRACNNLVEAPVSARTMRGACEARWQFLACPGERIAPDDADFARFDKGPS